MTHAQSHDRTNIVVAGLSFSKEYHLSSVQFGFIASAYLWTYALIQVPIGALLDTIGVKWMNRAGTILWSLATFMTALVSGYGLIILSRLLLGIAEAPVFPAASKATGYWFPLFGILCYLLLLGKIEQLPAQFAEKPMSGVSPAVKS